MTEANFASGTVWTGDNLHIMRGMNAACVDLIYLDPPFNSNRNYAAPIGSKAAGAAFKDAWTLSDIDVHEHGELADRSPAVYKVIDAARDTHGKGMMSYLIMMALRLIETHRILKDTGSLYLHCDPTASHYLKLVMDGIFGRQNFRNEIVWCYTGPSNTQRWFPRKHDYILFFAKTEQTVFYRDSVRVPYSESFKARRKYTEGNTGITAGYSDGRDDSDVETAFGKGKLIEDYWTDISSGGQLSKSERIGYPTQKPLKLLERIIKASSSPGDMVLDPFCGCATTLVAADRLDRRWAGVDLSPLAVKLVKQRIAADRGLWGGPTVLDKPPLRTDLGTLPNYRTHRHRLYGLQEGICAGCDTHFPFKIMEADHILPRALGGTDHFNNLQLLCSHCNRSKGSKTMAEWRASRR